MISISVEGCAKRNKYAALFLFTVERDGKDTSQVRFSNEPKTFIDSFPTGTFFHVMLCIPVIEQSSISKFPDGAMERKRKQQCHSKTGIMP